METGKIKRLTDRGFGFIEASEGAEVFFHRSECKSVDFDSLREGQEVTFDLIADTDGNTISEHGPLGLALQRGDVNGNGVVDIIDAMFGAQYLVGMRTVDEIGPLDMASVRHDDGGDRMDIIDCMYIAQYVVGLRDCYYHLMP